MDRAALLILPLLLAPVLLLGLSHHAQAQPPVPEVPQGENIYRVNLLPDKGGVYVPFLGNRLVNITVEDISLVQGEQLGTTPTQNKVELESTILGNNSRGWLASLEATQVFTSPGQSQVVRLNIQAGASILDPEVRIQVQAVYVSPEGRSDPVNLTLLAVAQPRQFINMQLQGLPGSFQPDEQKLVALKVSNFNYYPDMVIFEVTAPEDWVVAPPASITLGPGEDRTVYVSVRAPQTPWFRLNPSIDAPILVTATSQSNPGATFTATVPTPMSGWYLPGWVIPHLFLLAIGAVAAVRVLAPRRRERKAEKGKPEYPGLPPDEEARLVALREVDPQRAKRMEEKLGALHDKRKEAWKERYEKRKAIEEKLKAREKERHDALLAAQKERERRERKEQKKERKRLRNEKRRKKKELKRARKERKKANKRAEKARREEEGRLRKELERKQAEKEKRLEKLRKKKEKMSKQESKQREKALKEKRKRLEELRERKRGLEDNEDDKGASWKFWKR